MIAFSIFFEQSREYIFRHTNEAMRPIIAAMFAELTTLGFISVLVFVAFKIPYLTTLSTTMFGKGEGTELSDLGDVVHMTLFLIMIFFLAMSLGLVYLGAAIQRQWRLWETTNVTKLPASIVKYVEHIASAPFYTNFMTLRLPLPYRVLVYKATRDHFVRKHVPHVPDFDFPAYLSACLGHIIAELVEIPMTTWLAFEILLLVMWPVFSFASRTVGFIGFTLFIGYALGPLLAFVLHAKIRCIVQMHCADDIAHALSSRHSNHQINVYGATTTHELTDVYAENFWFGTQTRVAFTLDCIRCVVLSQAVYLAIAFVVYIPQITPTNGCGPAMTTLLCRAVWWQKLIALVVVFAPLFIVLSKLPRILEDFTVAANIDVFVHKRVLSNVQRRAKTVAAFEALKVVQCLSDTDTLKAVLQGELAHTASSPTRSPSRLEERRKSFVERMELRKSKIASLSESGQRHLERRQRRHWFHVFEIFDKDGGGSITTDELHELLSKFAVLSDAGQGEKESVFKQLIEHLDEDGSGHVEFEEFLSFGVKLEAFIEAAVDLDTMKRNMYRMVDKDDSGCITLAELFTLIADDLGIEISMDDVYNIVADLDEDGNGELDEEEFAELLDRLHVYDNSTLDQVIEEEGTGENLSEGNFVTLADYANHLLGCASTASLSLRQNVSRACGTGAPDDEELSRQKQQHLLDPNAA